MEMTIRDYYRAAKRTINPKLTYDDLKRHSAFGMASEVGEIAGLHQKEYQGHELIRERLVDELGDLMWFIMEHCFAYGIDPQEVCEYNVDKLRKRYPSGFDPERSVHRETAKDNNVLGKNAWISVKDRLPEEQPGHDHGHEQRTYPKVD